MKKLILSSLLVIGINCYNLTGCISYDFRFSPSQPSIIRSVLDCENICVLRNSTIFLIQNADCYCYPQRHPTWENVNLAECGFKCVDELPCGGGSRFSEYTADLAKNVNFTQPEVNTITVGSGDGQDVKNTIRIASITVGVLVLFILIGVATYCIRNRKKSQKIPQIEQASLEDAPVKYLIPELLPVTPTGLYSVISNYNAQRLDEISLKIDQVVAIKEAYSDKWARGTNVTNGTQGFFPLTVLISDEKYLKKGLEIPRRVKSLKVSKDL